MPETTEINRKSVEVVKKIQEEVINIRWIIENFPNAYLEDKYLESDTFHIGSNEFGLKLDCEGEDDDTTFSFRFFQDIKNDGISAEIDIDCKVWLEDLNGNKYFESEIDGTMKYRNRVNYYFKHSFNEQDLRTTIKLRNNVAIFCCEVGQRVPGDEIILPKVDLQLLQKLWDSCQRGLIDGITIQVEDKTFKVSKNILAIHSGVFERMFLTENCKEAHEGTIEIKETRYEVMNAFVEYLHQGKVNNLPEVCDELFVLAHKYLVVPLQEVCLDEMPKNLNKENVAGRLTLAFLHEHEELKDATLDYVTKSNSDLNFFQIQLSAEWHKLVLSNGLLANEITTAVYKKMKLFPEQEDDQVPNKRQRLN